MSDSEWTDFAFIAFPSMIGLTCASARLDSDSEDGFKLLRGVVQCACKVCHLFVYYHDVTALSKAECFQVFSGSILARASSSSDSLSVVV